MKRQLIIALTWSISGVAVLSAAPSIAANGVKNAASYASPLFPNGGVAQGSIFDVFGSGLGPAAIAYASTLPLPTSLSGTSVSVTVNGTTVQCPVIFTLDGQVAAILPSTTPIGTGTITVTYNGATSGAGSIKVVKNALGIFTRNQQGSGPAVVQDSNNNYNSLVNAFHPKQTVIFWGTGLGPIVGNDAGTPPSGNLPGATVTATIGGKDATVVYAGRSGYAGEDQLNITIPDAVSGCYVSVGIYVNGVAANFTSMSVVDGTGTICSDPNFYNSGDLQTLANNGSLKTASVLLTQYGITASVAGFNFSIDNESGTGTFLKYDSATFLNSLGGFNAFATTEGSCSVFQVLGGQNYVDPVSPPGLDAGPLLTVTGPGGSKQMPKTSSVIGNYSGTFSSSNPLSPTPAFLAPGTYAIDNGSGGADVGAFKVNVTMPPKLNWTEKTSTTVVNRSQNLAVHWTGGDPNSDVYVLGLSPADTQGAATGEFVCVAKNSAGGLTVPAGILSALPASATISGADSGIIIVNSTQTARVNMPKIDVAIVGTSEGDGKQGVKFQ